MKKLFLCAAVACLSVAACTQPNVGIENASSNTSDVSPAPSPTVELIAAKSMYAAEALYNAPAFAYVTADANGLLSVSTKAKVKPIMLNMRTYLLKARVAYCFTQTISCVQDKVAFDAAFNELTKLKPEALALLPK